MDEKRSKKQKSKTYLCCTMCEFKTPSKRAKEYENHLKMHKGDRPFKCDLCSYSTKSRTGVPNHKLRCHSRSGDQTREGREAGHLENKDPVGKPCRKTGTADCLPNYPPAPTDSKYYKSPYCTYWALAKSAFRDHLSKCHSDRLETRALFSCSLCSYTSSMLTFTQTHVERKHRDQEADILIHEELTDEALERHLQLPQQERNTSRQTTGPDSEERAERHKRRREERLSLLAADSVKRKRISVCYRERSDSSDESDSEAPPCSSKDSLYQCPSCTFTAPWKDVIEEHLRDVHDDGGSPQLDRDGQRRSSRKHGAQDTTLGSSRSYTPVDKADSIETFCCRPCSFATVELDFFHEHMVAHSRNKNFGCTCCGYRTNTRRPIEDHVKRKKDHFHSAAVLLVPLNPQVYEKNRLELPYQEFSRYNEGTIYTETLPIITEEEFQRKVAQSLKDNPHLAVEGSVTPEPNWVYSCPKCCWKTDSPKRFQHHLSSHEHVVLFLCTSCSYSSRFNIAINKHISRMKGSDPLHESARGEAVQLCEIKDFKRFFHLEEKSAKTEPPPEESPAEVEKPAEPVWDGASSESAAMTPLRIEELSDEEEDSDECAEVTWQPAEMNEASEKRPEDSSATRETSLTSSLRNLKGDFLKMVKGEIPEEPAKDPLAEAPSPSGSSVGTEPAESPEVNLPSPELILVPDNSHSPLEVPAASPALPEPEEKSPGTATETAKNLPEHVEEAPGSCTDIAGILPEPNSTAPGPAPVLTELEESILELSPPRQTSEKEVVNLDDEPESTSDSRQPITVRSFAKEPNSLMVCVVGSTSNAQETTRKDPEDNGDVEFLDTPSKSMSDRYYELHRKEMLIRAELERLRRAQADGSARLNAYIRRQCEETKQLKLYEEALTKLQQRYDECRKNHIQMSRNLQSERQSLIQMEATISATRKKKLLQDIELKRIQVEILQKDMELLGMPESEEKEQLVEQLRREKETAAHSESASSARVEVLASMETNFRSLKEQIEEAEKKFDEYGIREMSESEKALREAQEKVGGSKKILEDLHKKIVDEKQLGLKAYQVYQKLVAHLKGVRDDKSAEKQRRKEQTQSTGVPNSSPGLQAAHHEIGTTGSTIDSLESFTNSQSVPSTGGQGSIGVRRPPPPFPNAQPASQMPIMQASRHVTETRLLTQSSSPYTVSSSPISAVPTRDSTVPALLPISSQSFPTTTVQSASPQTVTREQYAGNMPTVVHAGGQQPQQVAFQTHQVVMLQRMAQQTQQQSPQPQQSKPPQQATMQVQQQPQYANLPTAEQIVFQSPQQVVVNQHLNPQSVQQPNFRASQQFHQQIQMAQAWQIQTQDITLQPPQQATFQPSPRLSAPKHGQPAQPSLSRSQQNEPRPHQQQQPAQQVPLQCRQSMPGPQQGSAMQYHFRLNSVPNKSHQQRVHLPVNQPLASNVNQNAGQAAQPQQVRVTVAPSHFNYVNQRVQEIQALQAQQQQQQRLHQQQQQQQLHQRQQQQQLQQQSTQVTHQMTNGILLTYDPTMVDSLTNGSASGQS